MSTLELARRAYARLKARGNGNVEEPCSRAPRYELNERNEKSPPPVPDDRPYEINEKNEVSPSCLLAVAGAPPRRVSDDYLLIDRPEAMATVLAALGEADSVALDLETTGLDPRRDRVRLLSLGLPT